jgi:hypothetical protein
MTTKLEIGWARSLDEALARAAAEGLPVYVDFFKPT